MFSLLKTIHIPRDTYRSGRWLPVLLFFLLTGPVFSQTVNFDSLARVTLKKKPTSFSEVDQAFNSFKRDTVKMKYLADESAKNNYFLGQSFAYNMLGVQARNKSSYDASIKYHKMALAIAEKAKNVDLRVMSLNMMGVTYRRMDAVRSALDYHKLALSIAENTPGKHESILRSTAVSLNSIGNIYLTLKQFDLAEEQFRKALKIEEQLNNKLGLAINYQNLGYVMEGKDSLDVALQNYKKSLKYNEEIDSELGIMICHNSIGQIYLKQNKPKQGLALIQPTIEVASEFGDNFYIAMANINTGWALATLGDYKEAEKYLKQGLSVALQHNLQASIADSYNQLSNLKEKEGNYNDALQYLKKYHEYDEKILNEKNLQYTSDLIIKYDTEKKKNQIELLEKENEIVKIRLTQNNKILIFIGLTMMLFVGLLFIIYRQYKLKNERKLLLVEQQMMRSQMNPHFLFNSLNSIKLYIINNDKEKAVYYLNKFSKLIRTILASSQEKEISLADELETMELYINIENLRFSNKINYGVTVDRDLNLNNIKIPSLILQPFLENSIWHGLSTKEGEKIIHINIKNEGSSYINIEVLDNGIGRAKSAELKQKKVLKQKSIGIDLTRERLTNFAKNYRNMFSLTFEDLYDQNNEPKGTKVILQVPLT